MKKSTLLLLAAVIVTLTVGLFVLWAGICPFL